MSLDWSHREFLGDGLALGGIAEGSGLGELVSFCGEGTDNLVEVDHRHYRELATASAWRMIPPVGRFVSCLEAAPRTFIKL